MKLQCHKCSSTKTHLVPKHKLTKIVGGDSLNASVGIVPNPFEVAGLIAGIVSAAYAHFQYKRSKDENLICLCEDCGYWEKI